MNQKCPGFPDIYLMIHIRTFRESAGQLCRQVTEEEIARLMKGQTLETFTTIEVMSLVEQLKELSRNVGIDESFYDTTGKWPTDKLDRRMFWNIHYCDIKYLRTFDILPDGSYSSKQRTEGIEANNLFIKDYTTNKGLDIFRSTDDWIFVSIDLNGGLFERPTRAAEFWVCDGITGLKSLVADFFDRRKKEDPL